MDDLSIGETISVEDPSCLQQTVSELGQWAEQNHLHLNAAKCKQLRFCFKRNQPDPPFITLGPNVLDVVAETKIPLKRMPSMFAPEITAMKVLSVMHEVNVSVNIITTEKGLYV